jgi:hypothetical protein
MKITDNYDAKYQLWATSPKVIAAPPPPPLPKFSSQKFSSHAEMNEWKRALLKQLAGSVESHG